MSNPGSNSRSHARAASPDFGSGLCAAEGEITLQPPLSIQATSSPNRSILGQAAGAARNRLPWPRPCRGNGAAYLLEKPRPKASNPAVFVALAAGDLRRSYAAVFVASAARDAALTGVVIGPLAAGDPRRLVQSRSASGPWYRAQPAFPQGSRLPLSRVSLSAADWQPTARAIPRTPFKSRSCAPGTMSVECSSK